MHNIFLALLIVVSLTAGAGTGTADTTAIGDKIRQAFPDIRIDGIQPSAIAGLYEIRAGKNIFYSDLSGDHLIVRGQIVETATRRNLTRERVVELSRIDWDILPLDKAIVSGDENAALKLAVFTDPDCPYCKQLEMELRNISGVRVYTFLYPLTRLHPDAHAKSEAIWCSENRHRTFLQVILDGATPQSETCDTPLAEIAELAGKLGISGTPTLYAGDGRMVSGMMKADDLLAWLSAQQPK